jgi:hypothetical protein
MKIRPIRSADEFMDLEEQEKARIEAALRKFYQRERPMRVEGWKLVLTGAVVFFGCLAVYWWIIGPTVYKIFVEKP